MKHTPKAKTEEKERLKNLEDIRKMCERTDNAAKREVMEKAAPAMYEALKAIEHLSQYGTKDAVSQSFLSDIQKITRAALRLAEGKEG